MSANGSGKASHGEEWPEFELQYVFNPRAADFPEVEFEPDELVVYETQGKATRGQWLSAERGSYVQISEMR